ncbi:hypothetical protein BB934_31860 (plasmid) [Microvirga ossetica]|uniref:Uncharacterized protein n=1 Tax=Microvirga ossetica TaxID=1882682 RepID=A0A1B2ES75_9HYPH|nr:hypothetical protein BB934_31860 [Microvirga ossetica]
MATKSDRNTFRTLHAETAKAIQRGEKFARSLKQVVDQRNPDTSLRSLLETVEKGLVTLNAEADELKRIGWPARGAAKTRGKASNPRAKKNRSKPADLPPPQQA